MCTVAFEIQNRSDRKPKLRSTTVPSDLCNSRPRHPCLLLNTVLSAQGLKHAMFQKHELQRVGRWVRRVEGLWIVGGGCRCCGQGGILEKEGWSLVNSLEKGCTKVERVSVLVHSRYGW